MSHPRVDVVVFDLGGVLIDWDPRHLYRKLIPDDERRESFLAEVCSLEWNARMDRGIPFATAVKNKQAEHPEWSDEIAAYFERWPEMLGGPIEGTVSILDELHEAGVPLYALTNWSAETFPYARSRFPFLETFKDIVVSGEERLAKPEVEFYCLLLDRHRLVPEQTLFIDDREKNVQAARLAGMQAITFDNAAGLRRELVERGVLERELRTRFG